MTNTIEAEGLTKRFGRTAGAARRRSRGRARARCWPCWARTGRARPPRSGCWPRCCKPDAGQARICGYDVVTEAVQVRQLIALTGQFASVDDELTGTENLLMIGRLLGLSRADGPRPRRRNCWSGST